MNKDIQQKKINEAILYCRIRIEKKLGWESSSIWTNSHFQRLSERIQQNQKIYISPTTLKRFWGKIEGSTSFRMTTLDQMAFFSGFSNWLDLYANHSESSIHSDSEEKASPQNKKTSSTNKLIFLFFIGILFFSIFLFIAKLAIIDTAKIERINNDSIIPFSATISYAVPFTKGFYIKSFVNRTKNPTQASTIHGLDTKIIKTNGFFNIMIQTPKPVFVQLYFHNILLQEIVIEGKTNGWLSFIEKTPSSFLYHNEKQILANNKIRLSENRVKEEIAKNAYKLNFANISSSTINSDNCKLSATFVIDSNYIKDYCPEVYLDLIAEKGRISIPFYIVACSPRCIYVFSDRVINGKNEVFDKNLTHFSAFTENKKTISIEIKDMQISLFKNDSLTYSLAYSEKLGKTKGVRFWFKTVGEIHSFELIDLETGEKGFFVN